MTKRLPGFADIRRLEALGFRAWPAAIRFIEGTWMVRLTPAHGSWRLNSINPLDPADISGLEARMESIAPRFHDAGKPMVFRLSPLSPAALVDHLDNQGWRPARHAAVMQADLPAMKLHEAISQIPLRDVDRFVAASIHVHGHDPSAGPGLKAVIDSVVPDVGLFLVEEAGEPLASAICVHDGHYAGLLEVATHPSVRAKGYGRRVVLSALKWARLGGARTGWLQVETGNEPARALYGKLGFEELYTYHYRIAPH